MYETVKSKVKYYDKLSDSFKCKFEVLQDESLSPFQFAMYVNDTEDMYIKNGFEDIEVFLILYAVDIVLFANTSVELQFS